MTGKIAVNAMAMDMSSLDALIVMVMEQLNAKNVMAPDANAVSGVMAQVMRIVPRVAVVEARNASLAMALVVKDVQVVMDMVKIAGVINVVGAGDVAM